MATYVLLHGGWAGGWMWQETGDILEKAGHKVYRPSLTGMGERVHLASPEVGMDTHVQDVVNLLVFEQLEDAILVGYSYSGMVITGVAEQAPERIKQLIYLDAYVPDDGQSLATLVGDDVMSWLKQAADDYGDGWQILSNPSDSDRHVAQPLKPVYDSVRSQNVQAATLPSTFIHCTTIIDEMRPIIAPIIAKAQQLQNDANWKYHEIDAEHGSVWETHPQAVADLLMTLA